jgi:hypothetical protein
MAEQNNDLIFNILNGMDDNTINKIKMLYVFKDNENNDNVFFLKNNGDVFAFGSNRNGVLGFGHKNNVKDPEINKKLNAKEICDFKNSSHHVIARSIDGKIYCWGSNYQGRLGNGGEDKYLYKPKLNEYLKAEKIIDICCGEEHSLALTSHGTVYSWGGNSFGQVGSRDVRQFLCEPKPVKVLSSNKEKIIMISCGSWHSAALTVNGNLYCWGDNTSGQLGIGAQYRSYKPVVIKLDKNIGVKSISCGSKYTLMISSDENIHVFGENKFGQLGNGDRDNVFKPEKINHSKKFTHIATHFQNNISVGLSKENIVHVWGKCGDKMLKEPSDTKYECAEDIFRKFLGITVRTIKYQYYLNQNSFKNGTYRKNWLEISEIGYGSFGKVFEVKDISTQETFAIKKIAIREDSIKELRIAQLFLGMDSENLAKYYDVWCENDFDIKMGFREFSEKSTIYIRMEKCDRSLADIQKEITNYFKQNLNRSLIVIDYFITSEILIEILEGVNFLHEKNIIHRDLSLNNILLKQGGKKVVRIADFGLAKFIGTSTQHTIDVGNTRYQAPEVGRSNKYDTKADIFSLGVILEDLFDIYCHKYVEYKKLLKNFPLTIYLILIAFTTMWKY